MTQRAFGPGLAHAAVCLRLWTISLRGLQLSGERVMGLHSVHLVLALPPCCHLFQTVDNLLAWLAPFWRVGHGMTQRAFGPGLAHAAVYFRLWTISLRGLQLSGERVMGLHSARLVQVQPALPSCHHLSGLVVGPASGWWQPAGGCWSLCSCRGPCDRRAPAHVSHHPAGVVVLFLGSMICPHPRRAQLDAHMIP